MLRMAIGLLAILAPLQLFIGDQHGLNTLKHQPIKIAAMEAHWDGSKPGDFHIFAWPDEKAETNQFEISIPRGASLILTHDPNGLFPGLKSVPPPDRPPVVPCSSRSASCSRIGILHDRGGAVRRMAVVARRLVRHAWYLRIDRRMTWWIGFVAVIAGWVVTESGRQPWIVQGIMRTADAISPVPAAPIAVDARAVRAGLRHRVRHGHLLHQPPDREGPAGSAVELPTEPPGRPLGRQRRRRPPRRYAHEAEDADGMVSAADLGRRDRHRGRDVRHPRRLRSRRRHPVSVRHRTRASATR